MVKNHLFEAKSDFHKFKFSTPEDIFYNIENNFTFQNAYFAKWICNFPSKNIDFTKEGVSLDLKREDLVEYDDLINFITLNALILT